MPRTLGAGIAPIPFLGHAEAVYLMEFQFSGGSVRMNTGSTDIVWGGNTYVAVGGAIELDPLTETTDQQGQGLGIKLSGVDQSLIATLLSNGHRGRLAKIWLAHLHTTSNLVVNPEALVDLTAWSNIGATVALARVVSGYTLPLPSGFNPQVVRAIYTSSLNFDGLFLGTSIRPVAVPGTRLAYSVYVDGTGMAGKTMRFVIRFYNSGSGAITDNEVLCVLQPGWQRLEAVTISAPVGTASVAMFLRNYGDNGSGTLYLTGAKIEPGQEISDYEPGYDAAIVAGQVAIDPIQIGTYYMNEGFKIEETRDDNNAGGTVVVSTRLVSRLAVLAKQNGLRTNVDSHQALFAGDLFFKFVPTLTHKRIKWGG